MPLNNRVVDEKDMSYQVRPELVEQELGGYENDIHQAGQIIERDNSGDSSPPERASKRLGPMPVYFCECGQADDETGNDKEEVYAQPANSEPT